MSAPANPSPAAIRKAATLRERLNGHAAAGVIDALQGERRLGVWNREAPFDRDDYFELRLRDDGMDRERLRDLLGQTGDPEILLDDELPAWARTLAECFSPEALRSEPLASPVHWRSLPSYSFWVVVEPICRHAARRLLTRLEGLAGPLSPLPAEPDPLLKLIVESLPFELLNWPMATMVLELNVARLRGELTSEEPRGRFEQFLGRLSQPERVLALFEEYPVLARQLVNMAEVWSRSVFEVLSRLCRDWPAITATFAGAQPDDRVSHLHIGAGDRHRGGRSVAILGFRSGWRLVYKPRSLALDLLFQELLQKVDGWAGDGHLPFRRLAVLDRDSHGWVEHVATQNCASEDEVQRFYRRQGGYLALLYTLRATDIHYENVIASGEHPVIVDLESLLQPGSPNDDLVLADDFLRDSIVQVGLLPVRNWANESSAGLDVSGLGGPGGQLPPRPEPYWANRGTDEMHLDRKMQEIRVKTRHRPVIGDRTPPATDYVDAIVAGFASVYGVLASHREDLLAADGVFARMFRQPVRILLRPTSVYGLMLRESFHPDFLRDSLDRDRFFDKLWKQVPQRPFLRRVIRYEQEALHRGDVPLFAARPDSVDLILDSDEVLPDFFTRSGAQAIAERLQGFSPADLRQQIWFIRASIAILSTASAEGAAARRPRSRAAATFSREAALAKALEVGRALRDSAAEGESSVRWLGLQPTPQRAIRIARLGSNLYGGQAGVTLFLGYLAAVGGDPGFRELAEKSCATLLQELAADPETSSRVGAFEGLAGILYALHHLERLWDRPVYRAEAGRLLQSLAGLVENDPNFDLMGGSAGAILVLADRCRAGEKELLPLIERCGSRLLGQAGAQAQGVGWITTREAREPLAGFSHGNAGIAAALFAAAELTGRADFLDTARAALSYERSLYSADHGNWPDLRSARDAFDQINWCHGAPGIGYSRALVSRRFPAPDLEAELRVAVRTTLERGFGRSHCLCHGDLGNLDFLLVAAPLLPDLELRRDVERLAAETVADIEANGFRCGLPMGVETPGLMVGLAGIGFGLLRLAAPERVPSLPSLAPPPPAAI